MSVEKEVTISVIEDTDQVVRLAVKSVDSDGVRTPYDLSVFSEVTFYGKTSKETATADAFATYTITGGNVSFETDGTDGEVNVRFDRADIADPGKFRYVLVGDTGGLITPLMYGVLDVENV